MKKVEELVRDNVRKLVPYSCARDDYGSNEGIFLDANENPFGELNRYPDPYHKKLRDKISQLRGVNVENIFLGNGSDEVIDLCYRVFCRPGVDKVMIFPPTYGMYEVSAAANDIEVIRVPLDETFNIDIRTASHFLDDSRLKLIFICSPNNPTANSMERKDIEFILGRFGGIVIIDEAYADFSTQKSFISETGRFRNLIVLQTFSKAVGLAAVRIGMAFADQEIIKYLFRMKPPYNISSINQAEALKRLEDPKVISDQVKTLIKEREKLAYNLGRFDFVTKIYPSDANFILAEVKDAELVYKYLLNRKIIVRNRSRAVKNCLRITVGTPQENELLISELEKMAL